MCCLSIEEHLSCHEDVSAGRCLELFSWKMTATKVVNCGFITSTVNIFQESQPLL